MRARYCFPIHGAVRPAVGCKPVESELGCQQGAGDKRAGAGAPAPAAQATAGPRPSRHESSAPSAANRGAPRKEVRRDAGAPFPRP
jgi:hypothetical protein